MIEALSKSGKTVLGAMAMTVYPLPDDDESALPVRVVFLEPATHVQSSNFDQRVAALTPTQRATYQLVLAGKSPAITKLVSTWLRPRLTEMSFIFDGPYLGVYEAININRDHICVRAK
jgi:hypothetical protein